MNMVREYLPKPFDIEEALSMVKRATSADEINKEEPTETQAEVNRRSACNARSLQSYR